MNRCTEISTHTLTWSVTTLAGEMASMSKFQLTRSRGAWQIVRVNNLIKHHFNSHAHVERDDVLLSRVLGGLNFNSHAHVERDLWEYTHFRIILISTHTLTWSVTLQGHCETCHSVFQLTRSRGAWLKYLVTPFTKQNFNSHAHVERDVGEIVRNWINAQFQLTRSRGAWLMWR